MPETVTMTGVVLYSPSDVMRLVSAVAGERRLRGVAVSTKALEDMGLSSEGAFANFLARIRLAPMTTLHGTFVVADADSHPRIVSATDVRPAVAGEVSAAIAADTEQSIAELRASGVVPTMSAEDLMNLMRGDDEDVQTSPTP